ncbi:MAG: hypothetical protein ABSD80_08640 [Caulobacteraceae bacterium]
MRILIFVLAAVTHVGAPLVCHGPAPQPACQCLCAPTSSRAGGLIYLCQKKQWYCPAPPAKTAPPRA